MKIKIVDWIFEINVDDVKVINFFKDYLSDDLADFKIDIKQSDIDYEKAIVGGSDYGCELLAIYRKLLEVLSDKDVFLFHGSALICDGLGIIFAGESGVGKSTHSKLYRDYGNALMINDDKPLIRYLDNKFIIYGTPYMGKHNLGSNINHELNKICFIKQSKNNNIKKLSNKEGLKLLVNQIHFSNNIDKRLRIIKIVNKLSLNINTYLLECDISKGAFDVSYNTLCQK